MFSLLRLSLLICTKTKMPLLICTKTKDSMTYSVLKKWTCLATDLVVAVDPDCASLHLLAELQGLPDVARHDSFREIKGWQTSRLPPWMGRIGDWKGQCHEISLRFFSMNQFPQASEYPIGAVSNFSENLQRYTQLPCCHWYCGAPWLANISKNFFKKCKFTTILFWGTWKKMIHEKNLKQKILWHCPLRVQSKVSFLIVFKSTCTCK